MKSENQFVLSPYVKYVGSHRTSIKIRNHLTAKINRIEQKVWESLVATRTPYVKADLEKKIGESQLLQLINQKIILPKERVWQTNHARFIEIETSTCCNWTCAYCPNSFFTRKKEFMPQRLFIEILEKASDYPHIKFISLHGYNEPTIDPLFLARVQAVKDYGFQLVLYTNGGGLTVNVLKQLQEMNAVRNIVFNLPTIQPDSFVRLTGANTLDHTLAIIDAAVSLGFRVNISVQGTHKEQEKEVPPIMQRFPNIAITAVPSFDRCGILKNRYHHHINLTEDRLYGCGFVLTDIHIDINGNFYLCLEDYHKTLKYGNIHDGEIQKILESEKIVELRRQIWGDKRAAPHLICRNCILMDKTKENLTNERGTN